MPQTKRPRIVTLNVAALIEHFGGTVELIGRLVTAGYPAPRLKTTQKWKARNSIPSDWLIYLVLLAIAEKSPIILEKFCEAK